MTRAPRLVGAGARLEPVPDGVTTAVQAGDADALDAALAGAGLRAADGWPHEDTPVALSIGDPARTWLVVLPDGRVVGECGWKSWPDGNGAVEIGYGLGRAARARGTGTEAVALLVAWTEQQPDVRAVAADVLVGNEPSLRLLRRLGFQERLGDGPDVRLERGRAVRGRHVC